jgi:hypothetical protein
MTYPRQVAFAASIFGAPCLLTTHSRPRGSFEARKTGRRSIDQQKERNTQQSNSTHAPISVCGRQDNEPSQERPGTKESWRNA